jgi:hypothetical protein
MLLTNWLGFLHVGFRLNHPSRLDFARHPAGMAPAYAGAPANWMPPSERYLYPPQLPPRSPRQRDRQIHQTWRRQRLA